MIKKQWIVWECIKEGYVNQDERPLSFDSLPKAEECAKEKATLHPGIVYAILMSVGYAVAEQPTAKIEGLF